MTVKKHLPIFIVEDNKIFNLALKTDIETEFEKTPVLVQSFETGELCMAHFKNEQPTVAILDFNLNSTNPKAANGMKILDWIKKEYPETIVIMLTSEDNIEIAIQCFKHGASDYVVKTETKFRKINYSLSNIFKMIEAKQETKRYKRILQITSTCMVLFAGIIVVIQIFKPALLR